MNHGAVFLDSDKSVSSDAHPETKEPAPLAKEKTHGTLQTSITYPNGDQYTGESSGNSGDQYLYPNGTGLMKYNNGSVFVGKWKDGSPHGEGTFIDDQSKYVGQVEAPVPVPDAGMRELSERDHGVRKQGQGTQYSQIDGGTYIGNWINNKSHGQGTHTSANGDEYVGAWKDGKKDGEGTNTCANGAKYVGAWKDGKKDGEGTHTWANGDKYVGAWKDGKTHGQGTLTWANGQKYVGAWKDNYMHGKGTKTWADGSKYVGAWKNHKFHGEGTNTYANGEKYVGAWKEGKKHGEGTNTYADGEKYVGAYKEGKRNGQGTCTMAIGDQYTGGWSDNNKTFGTYTYKDGRTYVGSWNEKGEKHGRKGIYTAKDGTHKYIGGYKDGMRHGQGTRNVPEIHLKKGFGVKKAIHMKARTDVGLWDKDEIVAHNNITLAEMTSPASSLTEGETKSTSSSVETNTKDLMGEQFSKFKRITNLCLARFIEQHQHQKSIKTTSTEKEKLFENPEQHALLMWRLHSEIREHHQHGKQSVACFFVFRFVCLLYRLYFFFLPHWSY